MSSVFLENILENILPIVIKRVGMVSSVGRDSANSCASMRAGISRLAEIRSYEVFNESEDTLESIIGSPITGLTDGFFIIGAWLRMAEVAMKDLLKNLAEDQVFDQSYWKNTALVAVTAPAASNRFESSEDGDASQIIDYLLVPLCNLLDLNIPEFHMHVCDSGHAGIADAVNWSSEKIAKGEVDRVILLAVDSYLDSLTLNWLGQANRLFTPNQPQGLIPGEAAACIMLEAESEMAGNNRWPQVGVEASATDFEENNLEPGSANMGQALSRAWGSVLDLYSSPFEGVIFTDLNGEVWKSQAYGNASSMVGSRVGAGSVMQSTAETLGDVGAASGAVSIACHYQSLFRRYAKSKDAIILNQSDGGEVSAVLIAGKSAVIE